MVITNVYMYQKHLELDTPEGQFYCLVENKHSTQDMFCSWEHSIRERQGCGQPGPASFHARVHNHYTLASAAPSPSLLVPEVSSCRDVAATWGRDWRVMSEETGQDLEDLPVSSSPHLSVMLDEYKL